LARSHEVRDGGNVAKHLLTIGDIMELRGGTASDQSAAMRRADFE
jgi:hypothetical protein